MMSIFQGGRYSFTRADHWQAGVFDNFGILPAGLQAPVALGFMPVPGAVGLEPDALPAFDPCGQLYWLRVRTGELVRHYDFGNEAQGTLVNARNAKALVVGVSVIWVLDGNRIHRYAAATRQLLGTIMPAYGRRVSIAPDGGDGLWVLEVWQADGVLRHYDALGRRCGPDIKVERLAGGAAIAASQNGLSIVVLAAGGADDRAQDKRWRLIIADASARKDPVSYEFIAGANERIPRRIAIDMHDHVHVMPRVGQGPVQTFNLQGDVLARRTPPIAEGWRKIRAIAAWNDIVIAGRRGLARLSEGQGSRSEAEVVSTFITPTLIAPDGQENRWNFADIEAVVAEGNTVEISVASSRNPIGAIDALFQNREMSKAERFKAIDDRLPWRDNKTVIYPGKAEEPALETLRFLLNGLPEKSSGGLSTERQLPDTHIWLRVRFHALPGRPPPQFKSLNVTYPEQTYLQFLPAIYREEPASAQQLRLFLAPVEALFDDIDSKVDGLPRRIDPATAPEEWYAFLLRWLGFPPLDSLDAGVRKKLLQAAPELLARRGTMRALQQALDIVTGGQALVRDSAAMPRPWILPGGDADGGRIGPRLGLDTLVVEGDTRSLRLGGTVLGEAPLNETCLDPIRLIEERNGQITITVGVAPAERERLEPIIWSLLRLFVPAHCRVRLVLVPATRLRAHVGLGSGFVIGSDEPGETPSASLLADDGGGRLGSTSDLGCWRLPQPTFSVARLNRSAIGNGGQNLN
jgi:phage tail-like protein